MERSRADRPAHWQGGWHTQARHIASPNHGPRPDGASIDLALIHSISLPPGVFGGDFIEALFCNTLDCSAHPYFAALQGLEVSSHFVIRRDGELLQFVDVERRAWHAGRSHWHGRDNCNDFSVGIELEGLEGEAFETPQYHRLATLLTDLCARWPVRDIVGHEHVAPGRKQDPGPGFDWAHLQGQLAPLGCTAAIPDELLASRS